MADGQPARLVRFCAFLAVITGTGLLGGCSSLSGYPEDPQNPGTPGNSAALTALRDKYFSPGIDACYRAGDCTAELGLKGKQAIRDDVVLNRMHVYDMEFTLFVRDLSGANNSLSVGSDLTALVLNGLGATTGDAASKAALAAASGGVIAANGAVNKDLFYQKTVPAIIAQMRADRQTVEASILLALGKTDADYPLQKAVLDLDTLNDAGGLNSAIASITQKSSESQATAQNVVDINRTGTMSTSDTTVKIQAWLTADPANAGKLAKWWVDNAPKELSSAPVEMLVDSPANEFETQRARAIADAALAIK